MKNSHKISILVLGVTSILAIFSILLFDTKQDGGRDSRQQFINLLIYEVGNIKRIQTNLVLLSKGNQTDSLMYKMIYYQGYRDALYDIHSKINKENNDARRN